MKKKIIIALSILLFICTALLAFHYIEKNAYYGTGINETSFSYTYTIDEQEITVILVANENIKNFNFSIHCDRKNNVLHQYSETHIIDFFEAGSTKIYKIKLIDIIEDYPWLEKWKLDQVQIMQYSGKTQRK